MFLDLIPLDLFVGLRTRVCEQMQVERCFDHSMEKNPCQLFFYGALTSAGAGADTSFLCLAFFLEGQLLSTGRDRPEERGEDGANIGFLCPAFFLHGPPGPVPGWPEECGEAGVNSGFLCLTFFFLKESKKAFIDFLYLLERLFGRSVIVYEKIGAGLFFLEGHLRPYEPQGALPVYAVTRH